MIECIIPITKAIENIIDAGNIKLTVSITVSASSNSFTMIGDNNTIYKVRKIDLNSCDIQVG
jgi:hypothetical protein